MLDLSRILRFFLPERISYLMVCLSESCLSFAFIDKGGVALLKVS